MDCKHEHIMSKNCKLYCMDCGAELPEDYLRPKEEKKPAPKKRPAK